MPDKNFYNFLNKQTTELSKIANKIYSLTDYDNHPLYKIETIEDNNLNLLCRMVNFESICTANGVIKDDLIFTFNDCITNKMKWKSTIKIEIVGDELYLYLELSKMFDEKEIEIEYMNKFHNLEKTLNYTSTKIKYKKENDIWKLINYNQPYCKFYNIIMDDYGLPLFISYAYSYSIAYKGISKESKKTFCFFVQFSSTLTQNLVDMYSNKSYRVTKSLEKGDLLIELKKCYEDVITVEKLRREQLQSRGNGFINYFILKKIIGQNFNRQIDDIIYGNTDISISDYTFDSVVIDDEIIHFTKESFKVYLKKLNDYHRKFVNLFKKLIYLRTLSWSFEKHVKTEEKGKKDFNDAIINTMKSLEVSWFFTKTTFGSLFNSTGQKYKLNTELKEKPLFLSNYYNLNKNLIAETVLIIVDCLKFMNIRDSSLSKKNWIVADNHQKLHAEMRLLELCISNNYQPPKFVGLHKLSCPICYYIISRYKQDNDLNNILNVTGNHQNLTTWKIPSFAKHFFPSTIKSLAFSDSDAGKRVYYGILYITQNYYKSKSRKFVEGLELLTELDTMHNNTIYFENNILMIKNVTAFFKSEFIENLFLRGDARKSNSRRSSVSSRSSQQY